MAGDAERLACYDSIFRAAPTAEGVVEMTLESEQLIPAVPSGRGNATMSLVCEAGELTVRFGFAGNVLAAMGSPTGISLQRDLLRAQTMTLPPGNGGTVLVMHGNAEVLAFLDSLRGVTNLGVRVTPANARSLNVRFRVADLAEQAAPVVAACR